MSDLKTDYKDDVLDVSANVKRIFNLVDQDGKIVVANVSIQDITKYIQEGDSFGAADINATNEAVNGKLDGSSTVNPMLATEEGFAADAYQTKLQLESCFQSVSDGKALIASAITDKKVPTDADATFAEMAEHIAGLKLGSGNAVPADVKKGKTFTNSDGVEYTGTYDFAFETSATAVASKITKGYTAWVKGKLITGTRPAPVTKLSGTFELWIPYTEWVTEHIVTFSTPFDKTPTVTYAMTSTGGQTSTDDIEIKSVSKTAIKFATKGKNWKYCTITVKWVAEV